MLFCIYVYTTLQVYTLYSKTKLNHVCHRTNRFYANVGVVYTFVVPWVWPTLMNVFFRGRPRPHQGAPPLCILRAPGSRGTVARQDEHHKPRKRASGVCAAQVLLCVLLHACQVLQVLAVQRSWHSYSILWQAVPGRALAGAPGRVRRQSLALAPAPARLFQAQVGDEPQGLLLQLRQARAAAEALVL